jgi:hypothetical protein
VLAAIQVEEGQGYLVRVRSNLKPKHLQQLPDGSALVEVRSTHGPVVVRELRGQVRRGKGKATDVRLWTSLVDHSRFAARDLIALYGRRWEQEGFYRELKVDTRSHQLLDSQTELTALQEIAALILGYAVLVRYRLQAASRGKVGVLRISFMKTLFILQGLWQFLELASDMLSPSDVRKLIRRAMTEMGELPIEKRRPRSCPRAIRRPVSGWRRLRRNTYVDGDINIAIKDSNPKNI